MQYSFNVLSEKENVFEVSTCILDYETVIFMEVLFVKYDYNTGMVLLDLAYLKSKLPNEKIRRTLITNIKTYIKQFI